jgi:hypothetical protein
MGKVKWMCFSIKNLFLPQKTKEREANANLSGPRPKTSANRRSVESNGPNLSTNQTSATKQSVNSSGKSACFRRESTESSRIIVASQVGFSRQSGPSTATRSSACARLSNSDESGASGPFGNPLIPRGLLRGLHGWSLTPLDHDHRTQNIRGWNSTRQTEFAAHTRAITVWTRNCAGKCLNIGFGWDGTMSKIHMAMLDTRMNSEDPVLCPC